MNKIVFASTQASAGKTSVIAGIATALQNSFGYIKPLGDRLVYRKKQNWDYDANLIIQLMKMEETAEKITLGFNHAKLRYMYDEESIKKTLVDMANRAGEGKKVLCVESGRDLFYGASVRLDALSVARYIDGKLVLVLSGDNDAIVDDIHFIKKYVDMGTVNFGGVIFNKIKDIEDFENVYLKEIKDMGVPVLGIIPYREELTWNTMGYIAERLFAKVIAGEGGLDNIVKNILVGAMSTTEPLCNPVFNKQNKLLITSGDRSDMIIFALESDTSGIILTNNILPPAAVISKATQKNIPLLLVSLDTYHVAKQIDDMDALLTKESDDRVKLLGEMARKYIKLDELIVA